MRTGGRSTNVPAPRARPQQALADNRTEVTDVRIKAFAALLTLSWATASLAQSAAPAPSPFKLEVHGIASMTMFAQDGNLAGGNGQIGYFPTAPATQPKSDSVMLGADAR